MQMRLSGSRFALRPRCGGALLTLLAVAFVPGAAAGDDTCSGRPCIQIGTFNLDSLGVRDRAAGQDLRTQPEVEALVQLAVDEMDIEIVVLQEINNLLTEEVNGQVLRSTQQWQWLQDAFRARGYAVEQGSGSFDRNLAIAYDKSAAKLLGDFNLLVRTSFDLAGGCTASELRFPRVARFRAGELEFALVGAHLIAPTEATAARAGACEDAIRLEQSRDLADVIDSQLDDDAHVLIAGDFGAVAKSASLKPLKQAGFSELTKKGQRAKGTGKFSWLSSPPLLSDHVFYRKRDSKKQWVKKSTEIFDPTTAGAAYTNYVVELSDHTPVVTSLYTDKP